jgi:hypothetical protein
LTLLLLLLLLLVLPPLSPPFLLPLPPLALPWAAALLLTSAMGQAALWPAKPRHRRRLAHYYRLLAL